MTHNDTTPLGTISVPVNRLQGKPPPLHAPAPFIPCSCPWTSPPRTPTVSVGPVGQFSLSRFVRLYKPRTHLPGSRTRATRGCGRPGQDWLASLWWESQLQDKQLYESRICSTCSSTDIKKCSWTAHTCRRRGECQRSIPMNAQLAAYRIQYPMCSPTAVK